MEPIPKNARNPPDLRLEEGPPPYESLEPLILQPLSLSVTNSTNCPFGLEHLLNLKKLFIHKSTQNSSGHNQKVKYYINKNFIEKLYHAYEYSNCCFDCCCCSAQPIYIKIYDNFKNEVIHIYQPLACNHCCFPCCLQYIEISAPPGILIGKVQQEWNLFYPTFNVLNLTGDKIFKITGPFLNCSCGDDLEFKIKSNENNVIGKIIKHFTSDIVYLGLTFPVELDVRSKALLLGALFLINSVYFK